MIKLSRIFLVLAILVLSGCTHQLSQKECTTINWHHYGLVDGNHGKTARNLQKEVQDCSKYAITVNHAAYQQGYQAGVLQYCQPERAYRLGTQGQQFNAICPASHTQPFYHAWQRGIRDYCVPETAYQLGRDGKAMPNFCPIDAEVAFRNAYRAGSRIYAAQATLSQERATLQRNIIDTQNDIRRLQEKIANAERSMRGVFGPVPPDVQHNLRSEYALAQEQLQHRRHHLARTQHRVAQLTSEIAQIQARH